MTSPRSLFLLVALLVLAAACGGYSSGDESEEGTSTTIEGLQAQFHGAKDVSGASGQVEVEMDDNYFKPTILEGTPGQKLTIELQNEGESPHSFTIGDLTVDEEVQRGDEAEVEVTFPRSGKVAFICRFHETGGMVGALEPTS